MQLLYVLGGFVLGVAFTLYMFSEQIFHGTKVGYGDGDISPDKGCCGTQPSIHADAGARSVPPAQFKPVYPKE